MPVNYSTLKTLFKQKFGDEGLKNYFIFMSYLEQKITFVPSLRTVDIFLRNVQIRKMKTQGIKSKDLAKQFKLTEARVTQIVRSNQ